MTCKTLIGLSLLMSLPVFAMNQETQNNHDNEDNQTYTREVYIPQTCDIVPTLQRESVCCFCTARIFLQPLSVISPMVSSIMVTAGEFYLEKDPKTASLYNMIGAGFSIAGFITNVLMIKINNKLANTDNYIINRRNSNIEDITQGTDIQREMRVPSPQELNSVKNFSADDKSILNNSIGEN